ncbi:MAG: transposase [Propionicimonas sp.]|nr:transposase [Propionicimonas sp.]
MPRQARQLSESGIHHVMLRGINRQPLFIDDEDREWFLRCLAITKRLSGCRVLAYCLMTNHVHLVLQTLDEPVGKVMKRLGVRYVLWHNRKHGRVGHLFQDRFRSRPVDDDTYLVTLLRYVWNNPVAAGIVQDAAEYQWGSVRLLGSPDPLIDEDVLRTLVPEVTLEQLACQPPAEGWTPDWPAGDWAFPTDADASRELGRMLSAFGASGIDHLPPTLRDHVIRALLDRGLSTRQVAALAQVSQRTVRRVASEEAEWERLAAPWSNRAGA